ncbi:hypothetical protein G7Y89_g15872 [Cudoniella acicularis]|uniref:Uncharacterized protein n=1 Tax=Cudoniella acicularis TaxID=354080 RepID=A0A8H4QEV8_9HELO|nr:hypothetical protein G7Y89_g15872 [Cudoniella acicularis]
MTNITSALPPNAQNDSAGEGPSSVPRRNPPNDSDEMIPDSQSGSNTLQDAQLPDPELQTLQQEERELEARVRAQAERAEHLRLRQIKRDAVKAKISDLKRQLEESEAQEKDLASTEASRHSSVARSNDATGNTPNNHPRQSIEQDIVMTGALNDDVDYILPPLPMKTLKLHMDQEKMIDYRSPDTYQGKTVKEWKNFCDGMEGLFRTRPWTYNRHSSRCNAAGSRLRGEPHDIWQTELRRFSPRQYPNTDRQIL